MFLWYKKCFWILLESHQMRISSSRWNRKQGHGSTRKLLVAAERSDARIRTINLWRQMAGFMRIVTFWNESGRFWKPLMVIYSLCKQNQVHVQANRRSLCMDWDLKKVKNGLWTLWNPTSSLLMILIPPWTAVFMGFRHSSSVMLFKIKIFLGKETCETIVSFSPLNLKHFPPHLFNISSFGTYRLIFSC